MELQQAIESAVNGNSILFTGAGFSKGAKNLSRSSIYSGEELAKHLSDKCGIIEPIRLDLAADIFLDKFDADCLIEEIKDKYTIDKVSKAHKSICRINWKRIYTTNYDNIIELAFKNNSKNIVPVTLSDDILSINLNKNICVHINGYIEKLNRRTLDNEFKLTDHSYLNDAFLDSKWIDLFRNDLMHADSVFFIGYSLYDLDIKRILYQLHEMQNKSFFITKPNPEESLVHILKKFGSIAPIGTKSFATKINDILETYSPIELDEIAYSSFSQYTDQINLSEQIRDDSIFELLLWGRYNKNFIAQSLSTEDFPPYYIYRSQLSTVIDLISSGNDVIVYSDLGNGKTLLIEGVKYKAKSQGTDVFQLVEQNENTDFELENILKLTTPTLIIIEDYHKYFDVLNKIILNRPPSSKLLLTIRTAIHDVFYDRLIECLNSDIKEIDLNCISSNEADKCANLLNHYGLWGENSSLSLPKKQDYLSRVCSGQFQGILIDIIKSPDIHNRIDNLLKALREKQAYYDVIIVSFAMEIMGFLPKIYTIMELLNSNVINSTSFRKNPVIKQLIDFKTDEIAIRSSVLAQYVLKNVSDGMQIVKTLVRMAVNAEKLSDNYIADRKKYKNMFRELMIYSTIQSMLPEKNKRPHIIYYYESLKNLRSTERNPYFWFQYAIARLFFKDYEKTSIYFETSYSYARQRKTFNTYQIDNHYARYLLEKAIVDNDPAKCMDAFRAAHTIISNQVRDEKKHYPYRVASNYYDFFNKYYDKIKSIDQEYLLIACKYIKSYIDKLPAFRRQNRYVCECEEKIIKILNDIENSK